MIKDSLLKQCFSILQSDDVKAEIKKTLISPIIDLIICEIYPYLYLIILILLLIFLLILVILIILLKGNIYNKN